MAKLKAIGMKFDGKEFIYDDSIGILKETLSDLTDGQFEYAFHKCCAQIEDKKSKASLKKCGE